LKNRDLFLLGAIILVGAVAVELYTNFANPYIDYAPGNFNQLLTGAPQVFDFYKEGERIGTYTYTLYMQMSSSQTIYMLTTGIDLVYEGSPLSLNTTHVFLGAASHIEYTVEADLAGSKNSVDCTFQSGNAVVATKSQGKNQTMTLALSPNTVLIDNNDPAHWELLKKSFAPEAGKKYKLNAIVPQGAIITPLEFGVDTAHQYVNIGSKSYDCVVAREPNYEITLYFYDGNLIQYKNDIDNVLIVKRMP
jgi:hypothetical protein